MTEWMITLKTISLSTPNFVRASQSNPLKTVNFTNKMLEPIEKNYKPKSF